MLVLASWSLPAFAANANNTSNASATPATTSAPAELPLDRPNMPTESALSWATGAIIQALKLGAGDLSGVPLPNSFTPEGWEAFKKADRRGAVPPMSDRIAATTPVLTREGMAPSGY